MKIRLELARIQMAPDALGSVVVNRQLRPAFRTRPTDSFLMNSLDIDATAADIQITMVHFPGFLQTQHMAIKFGILRDSRASWIHCRLSDYP